jgi:hypothetical protein
MWCRKAQMRVRLRATRSQASGALPHHFTESGVVYARPQPDTQPRLKLTHHTSHRHPEVRPFFEARKSAAPQDDGLLFGAVGIIMLAHSLEQGRS